MTGYVGWNDRFLLYFVYKYYFVRKHNISENIMYTVEREVYLFSLSLIKLQKQLISAQKWYPDVFFRIQSGNSYLIPEITTFATV